MCLIDRPAPISRKLYSGSASSPPTYHGKKQLGMRLAGRNIFFFFFFAAHLSHQPLEVLLLIVLKRANAISAGFCAAGISKLLINSLGPSTPPPNRHVQLATRPPPFHGPPRLHAAPDPGHPHRPPRPHLQDPQLLADEPGPGAP